MSEQLREALTRLMPFIERWYKVSVFTADKAGEVVADMNTLRAALTAEPSQPKALTDEQIDAAIRAEMGFNIEIIAPPTMRRIARAVISADRACRLPEMPALTDEQIDKIANESGWPPSLVAKPIQAKLREFARAVEALCRGKV